MGCVRGNDITYPNKASFGASSVSKLALFEYVTSFPLPHPIKILTMLHQVHVVTRSFFMGSCQCTQPKIFILSCSLLLYIINVYRNAQYNIVTGIVSRMDEI